MICSVSTSEERKLKILVVEDNLPFRQYFKEHLASRFRSAEIFEAGEGKEALEIVESKSPALIFMDIQLPGENGLSLTQKIKSRYPGVIVVVVTTYDIPEYREAALRNGADRFIPKDALDWKEIEKVVESITGRDQNSE